jgi:hypothetical protein
MIPSNLGQIRNLMNIVKNASNPQAMIQSMVQNNPQMKQVMDFVNQSGGNPREAFYKMAKEKGVNPDEILAMLK